MTTSNLNFRDVGKRLTDRWKFTTDEDQTQFIRSLDSATKAVCVLTHLASILEPLYERLGVLANNTHQCKTALRDSLEDRYISEGMYAGLMNLTAAPTPPPTTKSTSELSIRAKKTLQRLACVPAADIDIDMLLAIRGCGNVTAHEIMDWIASNAKAEGTDSP